MIITTKNSKTRQSKCRLKRYPAFRRHRQQPNPDFQPHPSVLFGRQMD
ncbi:hypothetical protein NMH_0606 [Neisseria meningitidis H44/76]|uniref:Uncharacterized protein n=2 Tax=Neisseria meningitidis TaxID=487 RepID=E6MX03_NEIMH|nr:hypothetical protein NMH_0606 [Neisseria meningitidis H44/76]CBA09306.1 hypothetical protein predicted by Glimmer/Critica [Neisseria meningitidis alpha275]